MAIGVTDRPIHPLKGEIMARKMLAQTMAIHLQEVQKMSDAIHEELATYDLSAERYEKRFNQLLYNWQPELPALIKEGIYVWKGDTLVYTNDEDVYDLLDGVFE